MDNKISKWHWSVWVKGIVAGVISGAASSVGTLATMPEVALGPKQLLKAAIVGAVIGMAAYLKQSPVPQED